MKNYDWIPDKQNKQFSMEKSTNGESCIHLNTKLRLKSYKNYGYK
jgi:hypothetical protein